jgi:hypothetical protein
MYAMFRINRQHLPLIKAAYPNLNRAVDIYKLNVLLGKKVNLETILARFKTEGWLKIIKTPEPYELLIKFQTAAEIKQPDYLEKSIATVKCLGGLAVYRRYSTRRPTLAILFSYGMLTWRSDDIDRLLKGQGCTLRKLEQNLIHATTNLEAALNGSSEALYLIAETNAQKY